jgi:hypothetical protein
MKLIPYLFMAFIALSWGALMIVGTVVGFALETCLKPFIGRM